MEKNVSKEVKRIIICCIASCIIAVNIRTFVRTGGLFPGGANGLTLLIQSIFDRYLHITIPYTAINVLLNAIPVYIGFRFIGKKFTLCSCLVIFLTGFLTDSLPAYTITSDILLISIFGGLINGFAISLCLKCDATTGGTDVVARLLKLRIPWLPMGKLMLAPDFVVLVLAAVSLLPLLKLLILYLGCQGSAALLQPVSDSRVVEAVGAVAKGFYFLLAAAGSAVVLFALSIAVVCASTNAAYFAG